MPPRKFCFAVHDIKAEVYAIKADHREAEVVFAADSRRLFLQPSSQNWIIYASTHAAIMDWAFLEQDNVLVHFQDLIENSDTTTSGDETYEINTDIQVHKLDASSLTLTDVIAELERRGLEVKGFYSDDSKRLQRCFDDEHEEYVKTKKKEILDEKIAEVQRNRERQKKLVIQNKVDEEKDEIASDPRLTEWFRLLLAKQSPMEARINISNITARSLARVLWSDARIKAVDLPNMNLSDKAGAYIARALKNNNTLMKLELDGNQFGSQTVKSLADSLSVNKGLVFLGIGSNPLVSSQSSAEEDLNCIELLSDSITNHTGLVSLSFWRCGIGIKGGRLICGAISKSNKTLISVEVGYNDFDDADVLFMTRTLESNRRDRQLKQSLEADLAKEREKALLEQQRAEQETEKEERDRKWLEEQKTQRAEARRLEMERELQIRLKEEEEARQREHIQMLEEERTKAKSKKGKGKGKKGAKGKKK